MSDRDTAAQGGATAPWSGRPPKEHEGAPAHLLRHVHGEVVAMWDKFHGWRLAGHHAWLDPRITRDPRCGWSYVAPLYPPVQPPAQEPGEVEALREALEAERAERDTAHLARRAEEAMARAIENDDAHPGDRARRLAREAEYLEACRVADAAHERAERARAALAAEPPRG